MAPSLDRRERVLDLAETLRTRGLSWAQIADAFNRAGLRPLGRAPEWIGPNIHGVCRTHRPSVLEIPQPCPGCSTRAHNRVWAVRCPACRLENHRYRDARSKRAKRVRLRVRSKTCERCCLSYDPGFGVGTGQRRLCDVCRPIRKRAADLRRNTRALAASRAARAAPVIIVCQETGCGVEIVLPDPKRRGGRRFCRPCGIRRTRDALARARAKHAAKVYRRKEAHRLALSKTTEELEASFYRQLSEHRSMGYSWRQIAAKVAAQSGQDITPRQVHSFYKKYTEALQQARARAA